MLRRRMKAKDIFALVVFAPPAIFLMGNGGYQAFRTIRVLVANEVVEGRVVEMVENRSGKSRSFSPVFEYVYRGQTFRGRAHTLERPPGDHRVGDAESLSVDPRDPKNVYLRTFEDRWGGALASFLFGAFVAAILYWTGTKEAVETHPHS